MPKEVFSAHPAAACGDAQSKTFGMLKTSVAQKVNSMVVKIFIHRDQKYFSETEVKFEIVEEMLKNELDDDFADLKFELVYSDKFDQFAVVDPTSTECDINNVQGSINSILEDMPYDERYFAGAQWEDNS